MPSVLAHRLSPVGPSGEENTVSELTLEGPASRCLCLVVLRVYPKSHKDPCEAFPEWVPSGPKNVSEGKLITALADLTVLNAKPGRVNWNLICSAKLQQTRKLSSKYI